MNHVQDVFMSNSVFGWMQMANNIEPHVVNRGNYVRVAVPFNSVFIFKDSNFPRV